MTAALLATVGVTACGSSSGGSSSGTPTVTASQAVAATTAGESQTTATAGTATASATSETATSTASSKTSTHTLAPVKPTTKDKAAVVDLCRASVESQSQIAAATRTTLARLCGTAVDASSVHDRRKAAEAICLGLVGAGPGTSEQAKKIVLNDCKTNAWD